MVKFLEGTQYNGEQVPVCTYWSTEFTTDVEEDFAEIQSQSNPGHCIANHFFAREDISCFNEGQCNGEGKCLPCTKYKYSGMRMAISHSPPLEFFRQFNKGITETDILSPQLRAVGSSVQSVAQDQLPFHILLRNIQAEVAKCCRWAAGDGEPSKFIITPIIAGPDTITITEADGSTTQLAGIRVNNEVFPDEGTDTNPEGGSFFPVGLLVVAGWEDEPSFYLEPRTGLVKNGEGVVFRSSSNSNSSLSRTKSLASQAPGAADNAVSAITVARSQALSLLNSEINFANNLFQSNAPDSVKEAAQAEVDAKQAAFDAIDAALTEANTLSSTIDTQSSDTLDATETDDIISSGTSLADSLEELIVQVDIANANAGGEPASGTAAAASRILTSLVQQLRFSGSGGFTKCELAFDENNPAKQWNLPEDGSLPCNGMRSDCKFYTGPEWQFATTEKMEIGKPVLAEAIQEIRFYSDDWSRFSDPEEEFRSRFSVPFIWAFKDYVNVGGTPDVEDMLLYRPKTLLARTKGNPSAPDDNPDTLPNAFDTMRIEKVSITDFTNFEIGKSISKIQPGQEVLDKDQVPSYATTIDSFEIPSTTRLRITHPPTDEPFIYRTWSPRFTNRISLFGNATPSQVIYIVNNTALQKRDDYNQFFGTSNIFDIPSGGLPGANSNFSNTPAAALKAIFDQLEQEKAASDSEAVLGFDITSSDRTGFWDSLVEVDLVHNEINDIFAFILVNDEDFVFDKVQIDHRLLHSFVTQDSFTATDFTIHDTGSPNGSKLGVAVGEVDQESTIVATARQVLGSEMVTIDHGYYAWRFKDRNLQFGEQNDANDLQGAQFVVESNADAFISNVGYRVVQYREEEEVSNWYLLQDCGIIMAELSSNNVHRVLPLPDQSGEVQALSPVLVNNGATGSVVAQWAPETITLTIDDEEKDMVLLYRSEDGVGLPANFIVCGPAPGAENLFGRPDPTADTLTVQYTYLRGQSHKQRSAEEQSAPEGSGEVITENFYGDSLREHTQSISFSSTGLVAGGTRPDHIALDQQDYCFVFADSDGRPIGRKVVRFAVCYYNLACANIEIFYAWRSNCMTYGLVPDLSSNLGTRDGTTTSAPKGTINPDDLTLGFRVASLLGPHECSQIPNCGDHEILRLGPVRKEFEIIANITEGSGDDAEVIQKAFFPSAGQPVAGDIVSAEPPGTQWQLKRGAMWYPYTACERPRYNKNTNGPLQTDTTELINDQEGQAGVQTGTFGEGTFEPGTGEFGGLPPRSDEAYRGYDEVVARILDHHPTLRACSLDYTYGNTVRTDGNDFTGYARRRGEIDLFWYDGFQWALPPFGNFGRSMLMAEVAVKVGDYSPGSQLKAFRWMPLFPEREDLGATVGLFGEGPSPESVMYRLIGSTNPQGPVGEAAPDGTDRYTHTSLVGNRAATVTYPHVPYFPTFLPDALLGLEPTAQGLSGGTALPRGTTTSAWAWREADRSIERGKLGTTHMRGVHLALPDYFLNNQRMEVRLRPAEENYTLTYTAPEYDEDGALVTNATLQLGEEGPPREIIIDFENRQFGLAEQPGTVYDTSLLLGDEPLECTPQFSSNPTLAKQCSCEGTQTDPDADFPAIFIHADALAPAGYFALYSTDTMGPAFPTDLPANPGVSGPLNICNYFIEHIYFRLDSSFIPVTPSFDPAFSAEPTMRYTWSRVPHGIVGGFGQDDIFDGQENLAQNYKVKQGVLTTRIFDNQTELANRNLATAFFPSPTEAQQALEGDGDGIEVPGVLEPGDPKLLGGVPVQNDVSQGQSERITLDVLFGTYVSVRTVRIWFLAGESMQVPTVILTGIPAEFRTGDFVTTRTGRILGQTVTTANGRDIPSSENFDQEAIDEGRALFQVNISPSYEDVSFWDKFYQEFHLIFAQRTDELSMGIYAIEFEIDALSPATTLSETIFIPERKYYRSTFTPTGNNPMEELAGVDNATGYWRTTSLGADQGANRARAYAWAAKVNNETGFGQGGGQPTIEGPIEELEQLQEEEYNEARSLMTLPYSYSFSSFIPVDEQRWLDFLGGSQPVWTTNFSVNVSNIDEVSNASTGNFTYGQVPSRSTWHAPGHAWVHVLSQELYGPCCDGCVDSQIVTYQFAHLHDQLATFEPAGFWDELPSGLLKGVRSIIDSPDVVVIDEGQLTDSQGNPISAEVLAESGIVTDPETGELIIQ